MKLEHIQNALFAAFDIRQTLDAKTLRKKIDGTSFNETIDNHLWQIIDFLSYLEREHLIVDDETRSNGPRG